MGRTGVMVRWDRCEGRVGIVRVRVCIKEYDMEYRFRF